VAGPEAGKRGLDFCIYAAETDGYAVARMSPFLDHIDGHESRRFAVGEVVIEQGARTGELLVLVSGSVEILRDDVRIAKASEAGVVFGEMSALLDGPATATVRAQESAVFTVIRDPLAFLIAHPQTALYVAELLARRLDSLNKYLIDVKRQYEGHDHLGMVDEVLETLMNRTKQRPVK
jgi:CRP/FNR family transcriptional regulator, cyclic AMP receptor protein